MINTLGVSFIAIFSKLDLMLILAFSANRDKIRNFNHFLLCYVKNFIHNYANGDYASIAIQALFANFFFLI